MSRIAKLPILVPLEVKITLNKNKIKVKGPNGILIYNINKNVEIKYINNVLKFNVKKKNMYAWSQAGTCRSLINSMILGVTDGFFKKLYLFGVGYRVLEIKNNIISLSLGYSHIIKYKFPLDIIIKNISQNEILIEGIDKQKVGQIASDIRSYRVPESYKGKGIRYENEYIRIKEAKKK
ncbi:50S ribosomal protein L6 [Buchnera aphidicola]|uniref:50S ribosomal protein L6 n=1 Tax=Buchnera aphidicola TaxID=9 RepID=UPI0031B89A30